MLRLGRRAEQHVASVDANRAFVSQVQPGHDFYQGALAGAVLTHQRVHLAREQRQADSLKHWSASERFVNVDQLNGRLAAHDRFKSQENMQSQLGFSHQSMG